MVINPSATLRFPRHVGSVLAGALLVGCATSGSSVSVPIAAANPASTTQLVFHYVGHKQMFVVPKGVKQLNVTVSGASGGTWTSASSYGSAGGNGGLVTATVPVRQRETLAIFVGGMGAPFVAGFNGGGTGGTGNPSGGTTGGGGGGGASDIRENGDRLGDRIIVAGGGGGGGTPGIYDPHNDGGAGGGTTGASGVAGHDKWDGHAGKGGTQDAGGGGGKGGQLTSEMKGPPGTPGKRGLGGDGGGDGTRAAGNGGGGGGGGYFGGGGGGGGSLAANGLGGGGGAGGGSSYVEPTATNVKNQRGEAPSGDGQITISWQSQ
jgi:hypothetical protein